MTPRKPRTASRMSNQSAAAENEWASGSHKHPVGTCGCFIVPKKVLERFASDKTLTTDQRQYFADAAKVEDTWRKTRAQAGKLLKENRAILPTGMTEALTEAAVAPAILLFDCQHGTALPGIPIPDPATSGDASAKRAFQETKGVVEFYQQAFGRNSLDNAGLTLISSIHFSVKYNNAGWNGNQMLYGDGDGNIFVDFTKANDVIGHELTHGITQYTSAFAYQNQAGGLNESMSDVFGSMYRQWRANQTVAQADWLIGKEIIGPGAAAKGFTCLRDMANPAAKHCLAPQPTKFSQYKNGMDPHDSSGIPNFAFYKAAIKIGGKSWEKTGKIWYEALTGFPASPNLKMSAFAKRTRTLAGSLFPTDPTIATAVDAAWKAVGL